MVNASTSWLEVTFDAGGLRTTALLQLGAGWVSAAVGVRKFLPFYHYVCIYTPIYIIYVYITVCICCVLWDLAIADIKSCAVMVWSAPRWRFGPVGTWEVLMRASGSQQRSAGEGGRC